ncbi:general secretion pathway protein B [Aquabacterium commune]|uniref:General secretion pathway protein B n=1 Tax=Aquabacterium commune TaxID=70586 RepID=A0A4R6R4H9_9BURK|nr:general secretion pathway protein GspB [Aquabacterium commune]TDP80743.1 general secretion pathway protein B [Aquabacterium commune]
MSYILDALKKADAEREREGVPSLHTQHGHATNASDRGGQGPVSAAVGLQWAVGGVAAGLVLLAGVWWLRSQPEPAAASDANGAAPTVTAPVAPPAVAVAPPTSLAQPQVVPPPRLASPGDGRMAQENAASEPARRNAPSRADAGTPSRTTPSPSALHVDASLRDAPRRVVPVAELPEDVRRELPALSIGGAMHSDVPANRMLVLNGSVFHEGDQPAPGLVLEEIKLKSAVFRFKDHRYSVAY